MLTIDCFYLGVKRLESKAGNKFYLATFVFDGEPFKAVVSDTQYDFLFSCDSMSKVILSLDFKVYNDKLSLFISDIN